MRFKIVKGRFRVSRPIFPSDCPIKRCHCFDIFIDKDGFYSETHFCRYFDIIAGGGRYFCFCPPGIKLELDLF